MQIFNNSTGTVPQPETHPFQTIYVSSSSVLPFKKEKRRENEGRTEGEMTLLLRLCACTSIIMIRGSRMTAYRDWRE